MNSQDSSKPLVAIIMGSKTDWPSMKKSTDILSEFGVPYEAKVLSAHRTPQQLIDYVKKIEETNFQVIIAGAGGAAHLAGVIAAHTLLPVLGVPMKSSSLDGLDSLIPMYQVNKTRTVCCASYKNSKPCDNENISLYFAKPKK